MKTSPNDILACPFCAGLSVSIRKKVKENEAVYQARCRDCGALGPAEDDSHEAMMSWNVRGGVLQPAIGDPQIE